VGSPATGKAFCCMADLHSAVSKAIDPLGVSIRVER
jgi:hypothetical protein